MKAQQQVVTMGYSID